MPLQDGTLNQPQQDTDECFLLELRTEADFYGLANLVDSICAFPFGVRFHASDRTTVLTPETIEISFALQISFTFEI